METMLRRQCHAVECYYVTVVFTAHYENILTCAMSEVFILTSVSLTTRYLEVGLILGMRCSGSSSGELLSSPL